MDHLGPSRSLHSFGTSTQEDNVCAWCRNSNLALLNVTASLWTSPDCGHQICTACRERVFSSAVRTICPAPGCGKQVRKNRFSNKSRETLAFEKECKIRRDHSREFNKRREDFSTFREYKDWQEWEAKVLHLRQKEDSLTSGELAWLKGQREENLRCNSASIARNETLRASDDKRTLRRIQEEAHRLDDLLAQAEATEMRERQRNERKRRVRLKVLMGEEDRQALVALEKKDTNVGIAAIAAAKSADEVVSSWCFPAHPIAIICIRSQDPKPSSSEILLNRAQPYFTLRLLAAGLMSQPNFLGRMQPNPIEPGLRPALNLPTGAALRQMQRVAGGFGKSIEEARTREEMLACLLHGLVF